MHKRLRLLISKNREAFFLTDLYEAVRDYDGDLHVKDFLWKIEDGDAGPNEAGVNASNHYICTGVEPVN